MERKSLEPWLKDEVKFYEHQIVGVRRMAKMHSFLLADDMGLGKTMQALAVFAVDVLRGHASTAVVICPASLKKNWRKELEKFTRFNFAVVPGAESSPVARTRKLDEYMQMDAPKILVINYEQVNSYRELLNRIGFDVAIFDEAHYMKNPFSIRSREARKLKTKRSFLLTGSPMLNNVSELWPLLDRINPGKHGSFAQFTMRFCIFGGKKDRDIVGTKNEDELNARLAQVMIRRMQDEVLDLPPLRHIERYVGLSRVQSKIYDKIRRDLLIDLTPVLNGEVDPDPQKVKNDGVKFLRMLQVCGTTATISEQDTSEKLDLATEDAHQIVRRGNHLVVFTRWRKVADAFALRMNKMDPTIPVRMITGDVPADDVIGAHGDVLHIGRETVKEQWEEGPPGILVCMYQVAGVGLNMTKARYAFMLDELFTPLLQDQAIARLRRIGATGDSIQIYWYMCAGTVEERVHTILRKKRKLTERTVDHHTAQMDLMLEVMREERNSERTETRERREAHT